MYCCDTVSDVSHSISFLVGFVFFECYIRLPGFEDESTKIFELLRSNLLFEVYKPEKYQNIKFWFIKTE